MKKIDKYIQDSEEKIMYLNSRRGKSPVDRVQSNENMNKIKNIIEDTVNNSRHLYILKLYYFMDLNGRQIARILDMKPKTVNTARYRLTKKLAKNFKEAGLDEILTAEQPE